MLFHFRHIILTCKRCKRNKRRFEDTNKKRAASSDYCLECYSHRRKLVIYINCGSSIMRTLHQVFVTFPCIPSSSNPFHMGTCWEFDIQGIDKIFYLISDIRDKRFTQLIYQSDALQYDQPKPLLHILPIHPSKNLGKLICWEYMTHIQPYRGISCIQQYFNLQNENM